MCQGVGAPLPARCLPAPSGCNHRVSSCAMRRNASHASVGSPRTTRQVCGRTSPGGCIGGRPACHEAEAGVQAHVPRWLRGCVAARGCAWLRGCVVARLSGQRGCGRKPTKGERKERLARHVPAPAAASNAPGWRMASGSQRENRPNDRPSVGRRCVHKGPGHGYTRFHPNLRERRAARASRASPSGASNMAPPPTLPVSSRMKTPRNGPSSDFVR